MKWQVFLLAGVAGLTPLLGGGPVWSQDARQCIKAEPAERPSSGGTMMSLYNTCDKEVFVFWCHDGDGTGRCGGEQYYRKGRVIEPGERYFNKYSLPTGPAVHVGACNGRSRNTRRTVDGPAKYACESVVACAGERDLRYDWRLKYSTNTHAIVRLEAGDIISWVKLTHEEFSAFKDSNGAEIAGRLCATPDERNSVATLRTYFINEVKRRAEERRKACLASKSEDSSCEIYRNPPPPKQGGTGKRG